MTDAKAILRYRDGRTDRVQLEPIDSSREVAIARRDDGTTEEVPFTALKAIFFPQTEPEESLEPATGMQIAVEFNDGEVIRGTAQYNPERNGFFLYPSDRSKNDRIFVVNSAIVSIEVS
ncbi:MAG TPA: hypothetical protein VEK11_14470 [Thermoanaerobaculia bacterium]|nr:hypothetical protein [Thermoanaerobaculia bacterium]